MPIDYDALARQHNAVGLDYDALASKNGGKSESSESSNPYTSYNTKTHQWSSETPEMPQKQAATQAQNPVDSSKGWSQEVKDNSATSGFWDNTVGNLLSAAKKYGWDDPTNTISDIHDSIKSGDYKAALVKTLGAINPSTSRLNPGSSLAQDIVDGSANQGKLAIKAGKEGDYSRAALHGFGAIPMVGPMVAETAEHIADPDTRRYGVGEALGNVATALAPEAIKGTSKVIGKAISPVKAKISNYADSVLHADPLSHDSIDIANKYNVPLRAGDKSGNHFVQHAQKTMAHSLAGMDIAADVAERQKAGMNAGAMDLSNGMQDHPLDTVDKIGNSLLGKIKDLDTQADQHYDNFRGLSDKNSVKSVVGYKQGNILDPSGNPVMSPITQDISFPIETDKLKSVFKNKWEELNKYPEAVQAFNGDAGYRSLRDIMNLPDVVPAHVAEDVLGKIKAVTREADLPELRDKAQGVAAKATQVFQSMIDNAVRDASPEAQQALQNGRKSVAQKYETRALLKDLGYDFQKNSFTGNPIDRLTNGKPSSYPLLERTLSADPELKGNLRDSYLNNLLSPAMTGEGFGRVGGATQGASGSTISAKWNQLNPRVKNALFEPEHARNVSAFLDLSRRLEENPNGSNTGMANKVAHMLDLGGILAMSDGVLSHPLTSVATAGTGFMAMRQLAKLLHNPDAADNLVKVFRNGTGSRIGKASLGNLKMMRNNGMLNLPNSLPQQQSNSQ